MKAPPRWANVLLLSIVVTVIAAVVWAWWAELDEVTASTGQVVPASKVQLVQNLEGGIVSEIFAEEGQRITKGDLLLRIDPTGFGSLLNESRERQAGMLASVARLTAEANGADLVFPASLSETWPDLIVRERALFNSRREELEANLTVYREQVRQRYQEVLEIENQILVLKRSLALAEEELELMRPAVREGVISRVELIRAESRVNDLAGRLSSATLSLPRVKAALAEAEQRLTERESQFRSTALGELNKTEVELSALAQSIAAQQDRVFRTEVRSPMDGIVKSVNITTIGQVVQPGKDLVEVVPIEDTLLIEGKVRPSDIAFLRPGLPAVVRISAYDFTVFGGMQGKLVRIGADTFEDEDRNPYYKIQVRTEKNYLGEDGEGHLILPGMVAEIDIITGKKTVLQYLTNPLIRMREKALRER